MKEEKSVRGEVGDRFKLLAADEVENFGEVI
jgi:hypothetical protein